MSKQLDCMALKVTNLNVLRYIEARDKINRHYDIRRKERIDTNAIP